MVPSVHMSTLKSLKKDFKKLGIEPGMTIIVHSSLKSVGAVCGGPVAIILALEELLTNEGTLVMPTFNTDLTDPARWTAPPIMQNQLQEILDEMPVFDLDLTPTRNMGCVSETFRKQPGVIRSSHPHLSFAAWGKHAVDVCSDHSLEYGLSVESPLARIYELGGFVLLLGVEHNRNTSMHLAEYDSRTNRSRIREKAPMVVNGNRQWVEFDEIDLDCSDFLEIGIEFESYSDEINYSNVGEAKAKFMPQSELVDYARTYMRQQST